MMNFVPSMQLSGVQKFTMLDYPDTPACIAFTPGCTFRCGYCHNPEFVLPEQIQKIKASFIPEETFFSFLEKRKGLLDGVVVSGGEPTIQKDLVAFCSQVKQRGFLVKLDTNGNKPDVLEHLLREQVVDFIAMDVKASLSTYKALVGKQASPQALKESILLIMSSGLPYEFRSTLVKGWHTKEHLQDMAALLKGAKRLSLQTFRPAKTLAPSFGRMQGFSPSEMEQFEREIFAPGIEQVSIR